MPESGWLDSSVSQGPRSGRAASRRRVSSQSDRARANPSFLTLCSCQAFGELGDAPPTLGKAVCFTQSVESHAELFRKHFHRHTQHNVSSRCLGDPGPAKLTYKINHPEGSLTDPASLWLRDAQDSLLADRWLKLSPHWPLGQPQAVAQPGDSETESFPVGSFADVLTSQVRLLDDILVGAILYI